MKIRLFLRLAAPLALMACASPAAAAVIDVVKSPTCGCCAKWVEHLRKAGHKVRVVHADDPALTSKRHGVPDDLRSCHSARVGKYVLEGHVPAADVARLLKQRPKIAGLAVPGMPAGSPGMEVGGKHPPFDTIAFTHAGGRKVFARHQPR